MIFVFGGAFSGKADYVRDKLNIDKITSHDASCEELKAARAIRDIHLYVRDIMIDGGNPYEAIKQLIADNPKVILISNEIGGGIVPADAFERDWRETVGRISCYLAEEAESVVRIVCGIGVIMK